jgi:hypothetical protein
VSEASAPESPWTLEKGEVRFRQPFEAWLDGKYRCQGAIIVATTSPRLLRMVEGNEAVPPDLPASGRSGRWRVVGLELESAFALKAPGKSEPKHPPDAP